MWLKLHTYSKKNKIFHSDTEWLNDTIMDAAQKLICKALGRLESTYQSALESHQSALNWQKRGTPFFSISEDQIQLMHNSENHWLMSFSSNNRVQICNSLCKNLTSVIKNCLRAIYISKVEKTGKLSATIVLVQKQSDCYNYGLFAIAFATDVLNGFSIAISCFCVSLMRCHLLEWVETEELTIFHKTTNVFEQQITRSKC